MTAVDLLAAGLLSRAAEHIETVGLNQDGDYYSREDAVAGKSPIERRCCAIGALTLVNNGHVGNGTAWDSRISTMARHELAQLVEAEHEGRCIPEWNDAPTTTQADVVDALRRTAKKLETQP